MSVFRPDTHRLDRRGLPDSFAPFLAILAETCRRDGGRTTAATADAIERLSRARRRSIAPRRRPAVAFLDAALAQAPAETTDLAGAVASLRGRFHWHRPEGGESAVRRLAGRVAWTEIAGPGRAAPIPSDAIQIALLLLAPRTELPARTDAARSLHLPLAGAADWRIARDDAGGAAWLAAAPGRFLRLAAGERAALVTGRDAMLSLVMRDGAIDEPPRFVG